MMNTDFDKPVRPLGAAVAALLAVLVLAGCNTSVSDLDKEVANMIAQRQRISLGEHGVSESRVARPDASGSRDIYSDQPSTNNPAADQLPARAAQAEAIDADRVGEIDPALPEDPQVELDLQALLAYAIENAPEYRTEKERLFLATLSLIIERHLWGPRFFNTLSADVAGTPESGDYDTALDLLNDFTVTQRLPYGGDVSVSALVNYTNLLQRASTTTGASEVQDATINASLDLPLLRGAGQVAREDLIQAERDLVYAAREFERFRREFFVDISNTYFNLLRQQQRIDNQQRQVDGLKLLSDQQRAYYNAEKISRFEADDAEAQVLFGRSDLAQVVDDYASSLDVLKLRIGMPVSQSLAITPALINVPRPAMDTAESIRIGQQARLDLQNRKDQVEDATRGVLVAKDRLRGEFNLTASVDVRTDSGKDIGGSDFEAGDSDYRVGAQYSPPLDRKIELAQYRSSLIDLERADRDYRIQRDRVALDIRDAIRAIKRATLTLQLQGENVRLAEERLESLKIKTLRSKDNIPPRRIIEAEEDLLEARNRRDQSQADLQTSVLNYLLQTGQMRVDPQGRWLAPGTLVVEEQGDEAGNPPDAEQTPAEPENPQDDE